MINQITEDVATSLFMQKDEIIKHQINAKIGTDWVLVDLAGRLSSIKSPNTCETIYLDGKPLVSFDEPFFSQELTDSLEYKMVAKVKYKTYDGKL